MWNGSSCILKTLTGLPRAAHTPLKFTPAAMTRTSASFGPTGGSCTSSMRIAVSGSPSRSGRIVQASILSGRTPTSRGSSPSGRIFMFLLVGFDELEQRAAERLGMEEGDFVAARTRPRNLVDERYAARVEPLQQGVQIAHAQREMVESVSALREELLQTLVPLRRDELERGAVGKVEERRVDLLRRHELLVRDFLSEELLDERDRRVDITYA